MVYVGWNEYGVVGFNWVFFIVVNQGFVIFDDVDFMFLFVDMVGVRVVWYYFCVGYCVSRWIIVESYQLGRVFVENSVYVFNYWVYSNYFFRQMSFYWFFVVWEDLNFYFVYFCGSVM